MGKLLHEDTILKDMSNVVDDNSSCFNDGCWAPISAD